MTVVQYLVRCPCGADVIYTKHTAGTAVPCARCGNAVRAPGVKPPAPITTSEPSWDAVRAIAYAPPTTPMPTPLGLIVLVYVTQSIRMVVQLLAAMGILMSTDAINFDPALLVMAGGAVVGVMYIGALSLRLARVIEGKRMLQFIVWFDLALAAALMGMMWIWLVEGFANPILLPWMIIPLAQAGIALWIRRYASRLKASRAWTIA